jgi:hypothetical protein
MSMMVQCWKSQNAGVRNHSVGVGNHNGAGVENHNAHDVRFSEPPWRNGLKAATSGLETQ